MEVFFEDFHKLLMVLPGWAFDELYEVGFPVIGLPYSVKNNSVSFAKVFEIRKDGSLSAFSMSVDEEEFTRIASIASKVGLEKAKNAVNSDLQVVGKRSLDCGWMRSIFHRAVLIPSLLVGNIGLKTFARCTSFPTMLIKWLFGGGR